MQRITLCISTTLVLVLLGLMVLSSLTARQLSRYVKENLVVTVILADNASQDASKQLGKQLQQKVYSKSVEYVSQEQALREQTTAMGEDPREFLDGVNPFPASLEVCLNSDYATQDSLKWISAELKRDTLVTEVTYQEDLMQQVNHTLGKAALVMAVLATLLLIICFVLINNAVKLGVYSRRFSIHTMKLVGASWGVIRRPFVKTGFGIGIVAGLLAVGVLSLLVWLLWRNDANVLTILSWRELAFTALLVMLFGVLITTVCSYVSVGKFLRMKAGELYKI